MELGKAEMVFGIVSTLFEFILRITLLVEGGGLGNRDPPALRGKKPGGKGWKSRAAQRNFVCLCAMFTDFASSDMVGSSKSRTP